MTKLITIVFLIMFSGLSFSEKPEHFIFKPKTGSGPFPVAIWLHGYRGYSPDGYFPGETAKSMQEHADIIGAVILGFPATTDLGDETQQWSEEPVADHAYIQSKIYEFSSIVPIDKDKVVLFGFSQGAMVAADLATIYPEHYMGAILMSPGGIGNPKVSGIKRPEHLDQAYFAFCGEKEHPGNVELTNAYASHIQEVLGAKVKLKLYPGVEKHTRPPDFMQKFPEWVTYILEYRDSKGKSRTKAAN